MVTLVSHPPIDPQQLSSRQRAIGTQAKAFHKKLGQVYTKATARSQGQLDISGVGELDDSAKGA